MTTFLLASFIIFLLFGIASYIHLTRERSLQSFEITTQNKDSQKGFQWYEDEIISIMRSFRHELSTDEDGRKVWVPFGRWKITGKEFIIERTPYSISITGTRSMVRIVLSQLDIEKIYL
jgi:hypothetical protein